MLETADRQLDERYRNRWYGKYRAFVRDNNDPERLGRCRLEIPAVLGTGQANWSEWAAPCFPYGGNDDIGMFLVPEPGASVWAEFEGGIVQYPIWTGCWLAKSNPGEQPEESKRLCPMAQCLDCEDKVERQANAADNLEHKKFHGHPPYSCPRVKVLFKSETGHTIAADDKDGSEFLKITDRAGQGLHFDAKVKPALQVGNAKRRGTKEAERGDQLDLASDIVGQNAKVELTDLARQFLRFEAWQDREKVHLQSNDKTRTRWQKILMDTTLGRERTHIWGLNGLQEIVIDSTLGMEHIRITDRALQTFLMLAAPGMERITLTDRAGSIIMMDAATGNIVVRSTNKVFINP
jgi:hypothetical protein